jgi:phosphoribosyl-AMP cyclohydrolase / phosphoribosyl-ATP pyrophosphohydrolase
MRQLEVDKVVFDDANGLIPVVIQDLQTNKVLMMAYMNKAALQQTLDTKIVTFYSRSKQKLWVKGETSGNNLALCEAYMDCDSDTLLLKVNPQGPVCHTGTDTCWEEKNVGSFIPSLEAIIEDRKNNPGENYYTSNLFKKGINKIAQKVGEEAIETIIEAKDNNSKMFLNEAADLLFHYLILLQAKGFKLNDVEEILRGRNRR